MSNTDAQKDSNDTKVSDVQLNEEKREPVKEVQADSALEDTTIKKINWAKKLNLPNIDYPRVILKKDIESLDAIKNYVNKTKDNIDLFRVEQENSLQDRYDGMIEKVTRDCTNKFMTQLKEFEQNKNEYFDCVESHCVEIVQKSLKILTENICDEEKLLGSIKVASSEIKDDIDITLHVHPDQYSIVHELSQKRGWNLKEDSKVGIGNCRFHIPLGQHVSEFKTTFDMLLLLIKN